MNEGGLRLDIKPDLMHRGTEWIREHPEAFEELVDRVVAWLADAKRMNLTAQQVKEYKALMLAGKSLWLTHSGEEGDSLKARLIRIGDGAGGKADLELYEKLEKEDPQDFFGQAMNDERFTVEVMPADQFVFDNFDPKKPKAASFEEAVEKWHELYAHANALLNKIPAELRPTTQRVATEEFPPCKGEAGLFSPGNSGKRDPEEGERCES